MPSHLSSSQIIEYFEEKKHKKVEQDEEKAKKKTERLAKKRD